MNIDLKQETESWLRSQVASGRFASVEEAIEALVLGDRISTSELENQNFSWVKPYLDEAGEDFAAGRTKPVKEVFDRLEKRFAGED